MVLVNDDGCGIEDFSKLLDLGGSGWDQDCEVAFAILILAVI